MDAPRSKLQKAILVLLAAMAVLFAVLTAVSRGRPGVSFQDTLLYPSREGETTIYAGKVHGDQVTVAVTPDGSAADVDFTVEGRFSHRCRVTYPAGTVTTAWGEALPRVEIVRDGDVLFRGGYDDSEDSAFPLISEDGTAEIGGGFSVAGADPWYGFDFGALDIFCFAREPALSRRGSWAAWALAALLLSGMTALDVAFPKALFYWRNHWTVKDPEPTDFYLSMQKLGWVVLAATILGLYIWGLTIIE